MNDIAVTMPSEPEDIQHRCGASIYTSRAGCWWSCNCGERSEPVYESGAQAAIGWALHVPLAASVRDTEEQR